ncbi:hypothetical protein NHQ30_006645 [Ciborinia camelliae]|nr:hypothetical protein NHQ30_006645 [Ciborinia camelliae]
MLHGTKKDDPTYLLDISTLSAKALVNTNSSKKSLTMMQFTQAPSQGLANSKTDTPEYISLKTLFESPYITKILFDVCDISHFLFTQCEISLAGVRDLQLMELAVRDGGQNNLRGLAKCVDLHSPVPASTKMEWVITREVMQNTGIRTLEQRPIKSEIMECYAGEVRMLPGLDKVLREKLRPDGQSFWRNEIEIATTDRIEKSKSAGYDMQGRHNVEGPWDDEYIREATGQWNDDLYMREGEESYDLEFGLNEVEDDDWDDYQDTARDCIGWEEDMDKNGEFYF